MGSLLSISASNKVALKVQHHGSVKALLLEMLNDPEFKESECVALELIHIVHFLQSAGLLATNRV